MFCLVCTSSSISFFQCLLNRCLFLSGTMLLRTAGQLPRNIGASYGLSVFRFQFSCPRDFQQAWPRSIQTSNLKRCESSSLTLPSQRRAYRTTSRSLQIQRFQPLIPPSPESLGKAAPAKQYRRSIKWGRRLLFVSVVTGILYLVDTQLYASSVTRSLQLSTESYSRGRDSRSTSTKCRKIIQSPASEWRVILEDWSSNSDAECGPSSRVSKNVLSNV
jgi:hypothetical protein